MYAFMLSHYIETRLENPVPLWWAARSCVPTSGLLAKLGLAPNLTDRLRSHCEKVVPVDCIHVALAWQVTPVLGILHDLHARRAALDAGTEGVFAGDPPPPEHVHLIFAAASHAELALLDCSLLEDARCVDTCCLHVLSWLG